MKLFGANNLTEIHCLERNVTSELCRNQKELKTDLFDDFVQANTSGDLHLNPEPANFKNIICRTVCCARALGA